MLVSIMALTIIMGGVPPLSSDGKECLAAHFGYRALRQGSAGEDVWHLQSFLSKLGLFRGKPTGYFGTRTRESVRVFQSSRGLARTGVVTGETLATLRLLVAMLEWSEFGYEVKDGDTLASIAEAYDLPVKVIAGLNGMEQDATLKRGDRVNIPVPEFTMHEVRKGETLSAIGREYGVGWKALAGWNGIKPPYVIYPGMMLVVPGPCGS